MFLSLVEPCYQQKKTDYFQAGKKIFTGHAMLNTAFQNDHSEQT